VTLNGFNEWAIYAHVVSIHFDCYQISHHVIQPDGSTMLLIKPEKDMEALRILYFNLSDELKRKSVSCTTGAMLWAYLQKKISGIHIPRKIQGLKELATFKCTTQDMVSNTDRMQTILRNLKIANGSDSIKL
jgi:hypothetical protein